MSWSGKRRGLARCLVRHSPGIAKASTNRRGLLDAVWEALNVARDNKALAIVREGAICNINALAAQLCERAASELIGKRLTDLLDGTPPPRTFERWETTLRTASGGAIAVEVTRQALGRHLRELDVYAIRDLRQRQAAAEQLQRQSELLLQHEEDLKAQNAKLDAALANIFAQFELAFSVPRTQGRDRLRIAFRVEE